MKKIKQMRIKAILLTIVAVLTLGFTSCTDELASDQTQGKPGYITINVKTLKPKQSKATGLVTTDYTTMNDLNIFIFNGTDAGSNVLQHKYISGAYTADAAISMQVGSLPTTAKIVVVANHGSAITGITTYGALTSKEIPTIGAFETNLLMTGQSNFSGTDSYESYVTVAPVVSKISVKWTLTGDAADYLVSGVYVVNAINKTKLPIIRNRTYVTTWPLALPADNAITGKINAALRTASYGLAPEINRDYDYYTDMTNLASTSDTYLKDVVADGLFTTNATDGTWFTLDASALATDLHYYVGENYPATLPPSGDGAYIVNADANANTIVVVRVTPKADAPTHIKQMGHKYYTYGFDAASSTVNPAATVTGITEGFSVRRKTNYNLTFALTSLGSSLPFTKLKTLTVHVSADGWNDGGVVSF